LAASSTLSELCSAAIQSAASDIILHEGEPPVARVDGAIYRLSDAPLAPTVIEELGEQCSAPSGALDHDGAFLTPDGRRFRVNFFRRLGRRGAVLRVIRPEPPNFGALGLPAPLLAWVRKRAGIVLVTGPTGSGKSTTLAAALELINCEESRHIVTIEDPVEYVFANKRSIFTQRDLGIDTPSFAAGLKSAMRQAPDVILVGEIRDSGSAVAAIQASETGHLVMASVHGSTVTDALERIGQLLPAEERAVLAKVFAVQLIGVLAQRLANAVAGGRVAVTEYFTNVGATRKYIEEGRLGELRDFISRSDGTEARAFVSDLARLCGEGILAEAEALAMAPDPDELGRALRGVRNLTIRR